MTATEQPTPRRSTPDKHSIWHRLYHGETQFDFVGRRRVGFIFSGALIVLSALSLIFNGLNLGIDFEGGVAWEFEANGQTAEDARAVLEDNGIDAADAKIQTLSGASGERLRVQVDDQPDGHSAPAVKGRTLAHCGRGSKVEDVSVNVVSPTWGEQITRKAIRALIVFFVPHHHLHLDPLRVEDGDRAHCSPCSTTCSSASASTRSSGSRSPRPP